MHYSEDTTFAKHDGRNILQRNSTKGIIESLQPVHILNVH